jgi:type II secretory pathway pseudopilin PulG
MKAKDEDGFTLIMTVIGITLVALIATVALTAVNGSSKVTAQSLTRQQAYEAALAGIHEYSFHLKANSGYWAECTKAVPAGEPTALNDEIANASERVNAHQRPVPGITGATYAIELLPANGRKKCDPTNLETATASMIEMAEPMRGTFRIRSTGFFQDKQVSVVATFKPASFLDYVYFTQRETSDPVTYGIESLIQAADRQCSKTLADKRTESPLANLAGEPLGEKGEVLHKNSRGQWVNSKGETRSLQYCDTISFVSGDNIKGPMHTNDAFVICESPTLGREPTDPIEVSGPEPGWYSTRESFLHSGSSCSGHPIFKGSFIAGATAIIPPESNNELETIAEPTFRFTGEVAICLEGAGMSVYKGKQCSGTLIYSGAQPVNGVVYDSSESCTGAYSPFGVSYNMTVVGKCGNVNVRGTYSKPLTIAAQNDVVITGPLQKDASDGMLGLIANNFIRIYHPVVLQKTTRTENGVTITEETCNSSSENGAGTLKDLKIEAALLAIKHSFIVDNYNCGPKIGKLNVKGAIAQYYRGAVGTTGSTGYLKEYEYDERLKTTEPPYFIQPIKSDWVIGRQTIE